MKNNCDPSFNLFIYATIVSIALAKDLTDAEQDLLGNFLQIVGQNLTSIAAFSSTFDDVCNNDEVNRFNKLF